MDEQGFRQRLTEPASTVARELLGAHLERILPEGTIRARIVETESYDELDPASHTYRGKTARNAVLFGPAGHVYVYFTYGMHFCMNVVTGREGEGSGVLIRAVEPVYGKDIMEAFRPGHTGITLTNGPAKLCQALRVDASLNGHDLWDEPLRLVLEPTLAPDDIIQTTRIGIAQAAEAERRYYIRRNRFVSDYIKRNADAQRASRRSTL